MWDSIIRGATSLLGGAVSGLFGNKNVSDTNAANVQMQREANELNEKLYNQEASRQDKWNERNFEEYWKQREYDSVANQRLRYEQAGINPYFALGQIEGGKASGSTPSVSGAVQSPQMGAARLQSYDPAASIGMATRGVSDAIGGYFQNRKLASETTNQDIKNLYEAQQQIADLLVKKASAGKDSKAAEAIQQQIDIIRQQMPDLIKRVGLENKLLRTNEENVWQDTRNKQVQEENVRLDNAAKTMANEVFSDTKEYQKQQIMLGVRSMLAKINLDNANAGYAVAAGFLARCQATGVKIDNFQKNKINWLIRESVKNDLKLQNQDLGNDDNPFSGKYNPATQLMQTIANMLGIAAGIGLGSKLGPARKVVSGF